MRGNSDEKDSEVTVINFFVIFMPVMKKILMSILLGLTVTALHAEPTDVVCGPWISDVTETSFSVSWITEGNTFSWIESGEDDGRNFYAERRQRYYQTVAGKRMTGCWHCVTVSGLEPGTRYLYRICGQRIVDESSAYKMKYGSTRSARKVFKVRTLDHNAPKCSFAIVSDVHGRDDHFRSLVNGLSPDSLDFFAVNGDLVSTMYDIDKTVRHAVDPVQPLVSNLPYMYVRGNHESRGHAHHLLNRIFPMRERDAWYYTFRQGPVAFIVLDAGEDKPDEDVEYGSLADFDTYRQTQLEWLKAAVKRPEVASAPVKICLMHIPAYKDNTTWYSQNWVADNFVPVLNDAGVNLMLSGHIHDHVYVPAGQNGNTFPILCSSNKERFIVTSDGETIEVKAYDTSGNLTESYTF